MRIKIIDLSKHEREALRTLATRPRRGSAYNGLHLEEVESLLIEGALADFGTIWEAAASLGITRHAMKRRILKHNIPWPPPRRGQAPEAAPA